MDAYSRAVRRISEFFDRCPDTLSTTDLKSFFASLISTHPWSTVKLDRNGLQFFYRHTLNKQWVWLDIVKPPQSQKLPDIMNPQQVALLISRTRQRRYQTFFLTLYTMGLRLSEGLNLTIHDIDAHTMQVHVRDSKGSKDRLVPLPKRTLHALRAHWLSHKHPKLIFPGLGGNIDKPMDRGVLSDNDIIHSDDHSVTFRYKESKTNAIKTRTLPTLEFLLLILQHVLPKGLQRVRDYGFLRGQARALRVRIQLLMLGIFYQTPPTTMTIRTKAIRTCPHCQHDMECVGITRPR